MNNKDILQLCFGNLLRRRTRTILSVIGVIIGTTAIIVMLSIGLGLSYGFQEQLESFGNLHTIQVYSWGGGGGGGGQDNKLDDRTIAKMEKIDGATCVSPQVRQYAMLYGDHKRADNSIVGMKPEMLELLGLNIEKGRMPNSSDKAPLLFGKAAAASFYDPRKQEYGTWGSMEPTIDPLGKFILTNDYNYGTNQQGQDMEDTQLLEIEAQGVGLLANESDEYAYNIYSTIEFVNKVKTEWDKAQGGRSGGSNGQSIYDQVLVYVEDLNKVESVSSTIRDDYGFSTYSLNDMLKELQKTMGLIEAVLGGIGGISLLVAAIGIANTMIMSVYERTREISVMTVIGASLKDIRKMFLLEAGMIGFGGGIIGIALSYVISYVMNHFLAGAIAGAIGGMGSKVSVIPWWLTLAALAFATLVGVVSGYSPAQRAMNLSVLEGLKNE